MTSNQKILLAGFITSLAEERTTDVERNGLLSVAASLLTNPSEVARLCPSQAEMEKAGWKPATQLRRNADDARQIGTDRQNSFRSSAGGHNAGRQDEV